MIYFTFEKISHRLIHLAQRHGGQSQDAFPPNLTNLTQTDRERRAMKGRILLWQLIFSIYSASADWNCKFTGPNVDDYDLSGLAGQHTVERTRSTPPTTMIDQIILMSATNSTNLRLQSRKEYVLHSLAASCSQQVW
jgi:hypothetical protein